MRHTATLTVIGGPTISKAFSVPTIPLSGGVATLTFTITNPNTTTTLTGVAFTDALPAGLQVAATPNVVPGCGAFTPAAGATNLTFSGGSIAPSGTCTVSVDVTGPTLKSAVHYMTPAVCEMIQVPSSGGGGSQVRFVPIGPTTGPAEPIRSARESAYRRLAEIAASF